MSRVRFYVATSLDGFIADREGNVDWLAPYEARRYGYDEFLAGVGVLIMGRRTYELIGAISDEWPYRGKTVFVLSSEPLDETPPGVTVARHGILEAAQRARKATRQDIWIVGGAVTMQSALNEGLVDLMEIFLVPVLLGSGLTPLNELRHRQALIFDGIEAYPDGVVKLRYLVPERDKGSTKA